MKYNKLVRDKIPDIIRKDGGKPVFRKAKSDFEFSRRSKEKLIEEAKEFLKAAEGLLEFEADADIEKVAGEFADICEIVEVIFKEIRPKNYLKKVRAKKAKERGRFKKRIILVEDKSRP